MTDISVDTCIENIFCYLQGIVDIAGETADIGHQFHQVTADLAIAFEPRLLVILASSSSS